MERSRVSFFAAVILAAVASLFTVCKATGAGTGVDVLYGGELNVSEAITLSNTSGGGILDDTHGYDFPGALEGYEPQAALSVTVTNTGAAPTGALTASVTGGDFTITPAGANAITSIAPGGTDVFTVQPVTALTSGDYTATVTVSGGSITATSFDVSFMVVVGVWLGGDWNPGWSGWPDDGVEDDTYDPAGDPGDKYTEPGEWIVIKDEDIGTNTITITVNNSVFSIGNSLTDGKNVTDEALSTTGVKFDGVSSGKVNVTGQSGGNPDSPLRLMLDGVVFSGGSNPIKLNSGANVIIVLVGENTHAAAGGAGVRVGTGCTATITSVSAGTLTTGGGENAAGIGGNNVEVCGTIFIGGNAKVVATGGVYAAGIGSGNCNGNQGAVSGPITIGGNAQVTATGGSYYGAGIGGSNYSGTGPISIGGNAQVTATSGSFGGGAGIGGGRRGSGGTISIGGNAQVTAEGGGGAGIGGGDSGSGGTITIGGNTQVAATGSYGAGIGGGSGGAGGTISIGGNAQVAATGVNYGAGIGSGYNKAGGTITISGGIVIARTTGTTRAAAIGAGGHTSNKYAAGKITISGGFVAAQSANSDAPDIGASAGYAGEWDNATNAVTITGGSVYAAKTAISPAPKNGSAASVYPLYVPAALAQKAISVTSPVYTASTIGKSAAEMLSGTHAFFGNGPAGLFPVVLSATLWLPEANYIGIITTTPSSGGHAANVTAEIAPYDDSGDNRLL